MPRKQKNIPEPKPKPEPEINITQEIKPEPEPEIKKEDKTMIDKPEKPEKPEKPVHLNKISIECGGFRVAIESPDQNVEKVAGLGKDIIKELTGLATPSSNTIQPEAAQEIEEIPEGVVPDTILEQDEYQRLIEKIKGENKK